jgi:putative FmdB family regulatory protein
MPIYEYRCDDCSRRFELLTSYAEREGAHPCPSCESVRTRLLVSSFAAIGGPGAELADGFTSGGGCACGGSCGCGAN